MAQPESIKVEPFTEFPRLPYSIINDDFCHEKNFVGKITSKSDKSTIKIKEAITNKKGAWGTAEQIKLWFDLPQSRSLYAKIKSNDYIKVHYDHGVRNWNNKKYYLYGALNCNKALRNVSVKAGVGHLSDHCKSDTRIRANLQQASNEYFCYNRTMITHNKLTFGFIGVYDLVSNVLQKNNLLVGYQADQKTNVFLRAEVDGFRRRNMKLDAPSSFFDAITFDCVRKINDQSKGALQATYDFRDRSITTASLVYQRNMDKKQMIKVKVDNQLNFALVYKRPLRGLENQATVSTGFQISGVKDQAFSSKMGIEIGLNL